jgi:hypothetical protein
MKYSNDPIFEAYSNHRKQFILEQSVSSFYSSDPLQELRDSYKYDLQCIEELMTEGMLGDAFGKVKGGISKATSYVANKGLQLLFSLIKKTATPEELEEIKKLEDPEVLKQEAKKGMAALKGTGSEQPVTNNESVFLNKSFFASILTESNIEVMLERYSFINEQILNEAKVGARKAGSDSSYWDTTTQARKQKSEATRRKRSEAGRKGQKAAPYGSKAPKATQTQKPMQLSKYVKQVADELKNKYSQKQVDKFQQMLSKKLGKGDKVSQRAPITGLPKRPTDVASGDTSLATRPSQTPRSLGYTGSSGTLSKDRVIDVESETVPSQTANIPSPELPYSGGSVAQPEKKEGIIRKAINWVKANPKRTAGTLVGIIAAIGVAVGGPAVLLPMLAKAGLGSTGLGAVGGALGGAGLGAAKNIASQGFSNKKFSAKSLGKSALKGAAIGAVTGALGGSTLSDQDVSTGGDVDTGDTGDTGDTAEGGDSDYTGGTGDTSATSDDFQKYNGEPIDPKSWRDKIKMSALDKFKREGGGQIDAEKYNSFVKKLVAMGKAAQGKSIESIMGESYTVHYLSLLR